MPSELKVNKLSPYTGSTLTIGDSGDTISFASGVLPSLESLTITGDLTVDTDTLYVDSTNNRVGIGTTSPSTILDIQGADAASSRINVLRTGGSDVGAQLLSTGSIGAVAATNSGPFSFFTSGTEQMRIDSSGNVGIGTSSPATALEVETSSGSSLTLNTTTGSGGINFEFNGTRQCLIQNNSSDGSLRLEADIDNAYLDSDVIMTVDGDEKMRITSNGDVGIGDTTPSAAVEVRRTNSGSDEEMLLLRNNATGANTATILRFINSTNATSTINGAFIRCVRQGVDDHDLIFGTTDNERLLIDGAGLVSMSDYSISNINGDGKSCGLNVRKGASDNCVISGYMGTTVNGRQLLALYSNEVSTNNLQHVLETDGDAYNRTGTWGTISSDERVKQDINPISSQWEDIKSLNLVNYKRKDEVVAEGYEAKKYIGVIAQQAEQICPSLVKQRNPRPEEIAIAPELGELEDDLDQPIYKQYRSGDTIPEGFEVDDYALDENGEKIITGYQKRITAIHDQVKVFKDSVLFWKAVGALQEAQTKIETLESTVADLTARLETLENT